METRVEFRSSGNDAVPGQHYGCGRCYATAIGRLVHPAGEPCPLQVAQDKAYIAKLNAEREQAEAQRDYYIRAQMPALDMGEAMRAITGALKPGQES